MRNNFKAIFGKTDDVFRGYLMVLLMAFLGALSVICANELGSEANEHHFFYIKFAMVSLMGISLMFGLKMLSQRIGRELLLEVLGVLFLVGYFFLLPASEKDFSERYAYLLIPTAILLHLLVSFLPFFGKSRELNFWQYNKNLFINIFLTAVFTGVLTGGVELAIVAVDQLFDFNFDHKLYLHTFTFLGIFGSCFIFLLFNEKGLQYLERDGNYPIILKFFTQYILIPLLLIYAVILYFYSAKILLHWELPRGWVSYLVLAYSVVGILALLLVHPLKEVSAKSWVRVFSKIFYYTLIPLVVLLFVAIFTRILEYGYTEPRYFVLMLAIWLATVVLYFVFRKKATIQYIPMSLFACGLFSLTMPYLNTFAVAKRSQKAELKKILTEHHLLKNGTIDFNKKVSDTIADEVSGKFGFLAKRDEQDFLYHLLQPADQQLLAKAIRKKEFWNIQRIMQDQFTNTENTKNANAGNGPNLVAKDGFISIKDYDFMASVANYKMGNIPFKNEVFNISREEQSGVMLRITLNGKEKWDATQDILQLLQPYATQHGNIEVPELSVEHDLGTYHLKLIFENLNCGNTQQKKFFYNDAYLLIRKK